MRPQAAAAHDPVVLEYGTSTLGPGNTRGLAHTTLGSIHGIDPVGNRLGINHR